MTIEQWKCAAKELVIANPVAGLLMAASFSSYLRQIFPALTPACLIHLHGSPGSGKSMTAKAVTSMTTSKPLLWLGATQVFCERSLSNERTEPSFFDEVSGWNQTDFVSRLVQLANAGSRVKLTDDEQPMWNKTIFTASTGRLLAAGIKSSDIMLEALEDRIIEIDVDKYILWSSLDHCTSLTSLKLENSVFSHEVQKLLFQSNIFKEKYEQKFTQNYANNLRYSPKYRRKAQNLALFSCGADLMKEFLALDESHISAVMGVLDSLMRDNLVESLKKAPATTSQSNLAKLDGDVQKIALQHGLIAGAINTLVLLRNSDMFHADILDSLKDGLSQKLKSVNSMYKSELCDESQAEFLLKDFMEGQQTVVASTLPADLVLEGI